MLKRGRPGISKLCRRFILRATVFNTLPFPRQQILDSSKLKEFADDNFKFKESGGKFSKWVEYTEGKGEIARCGQCLLFPQCFQMSCAADTLKPGLVCEMVNYSANYVKTLWEKGVNTGNQHFLYFPKMLSTLLKKKCTILYTLELSSANAFILD